MNGSTDLEKNLASKFPNWNFSVQKTGAATWVNLNDGNHFFNIQVTPSEGVGVSIINKGYGIDMSGHDEVFDDIDQVVNYIERVISSKSI